MTTSIARWRWSSIGRGMFATPGVLSNPFAIATLQTTRTVNGRSSFEFWNSATRTWTFSSPSGRQRFATLDVNGNVVQTRTDGLLGRTNSYDLQGRFFSSLVGTSPTGRQDVVSFFDTTDASNGYIASATNPLGQITDLTPDPLGRVVQVIEPDGAATGFAWDADGNLSAAVPPGRPAHEMGHTPVGLLSTYDPPVLMTLPEPRTVYEYRPDRQLERVTRPDGLVVAYGYDSSGRPT